MARCGGARPVGARDQPNSEPNRSPRPGPKPNPDPKPERGPSTGPKPRPGSARAITGTDGRRYYGVVLDRGFEMDARVHGARVRWEAAAPDTLAYAREEGGRRGAAAELQVDR